MLLRAAAQLRTALQQQRSSWMIMLRHPPARLADVSNLLQEGDAAGQLRLRDARQGDGTPAPVTKLGVSGWQVLPQVWQRCLLGLRARVGPHSAAIRAIAWLPLLAWLGPAAMRTKFDLAHGSGAAGTPAPPDPYLPVPLPPRWVQVFKYGDTHSGGSTKLEIYFSFGGLLMKLVGDPSKLKVIEVDSTVYLLIRRL